MKTIFALLVVLAHIGLGNAADFCAPQSKSCVDLPQSSAKACSSLISKSGLRLTTCSKAKSTITKTSTVQPSTTQTVTVTQTVTLSSASNVQRTILKTVTSTAVSQATSIQTSTNTAQTTIIVPKTLTATEIITTTTTDTSTIPYQQETCAAGAPVVRRRGNSYKALNTIPRDCSCYLTTTKSCSQPTTTWSTITKPTSTAYVTRYKLTTLTRYNSRTLDFVRTTTVVATAVSTGLLTTTVGTTETVSVTSVVATTTITTTSTATATQTIQADPCADPVLYTSTRPDFPGSVWGSMRDSRSPRDCCYSCFGTNSGCLFWKFTNQVCTTFVIPNKNEAVSCITKSCRKGRPALVATAGDGAIYGVGICAAAGFSG